eukprot:CAMPEP_0185768158 /NCGR_PEP_ID=MMETSP1174-20130828/47893_1 /TAXON_ID=35687 /ORGANISM="Dictyocha speculum, Strain CCMP1381" /LENGTH=80 /DNA_ID=CAMNT_0028452727 /DNA_START=17 /DNA_END=259 /DNA_ORIENTATION=-
MGTKNAAKPVAERASHDGGYLKKEKRRLTKMKSKINYHYARGKSGVPSSFCEGQADYDECQKLHAQIKMIEDAAIARACA